MEGLSPQILLLQESKREQQFRLTAANEQFCDWLNFDQMDVYLRDEKPCINPSKRQISSSNTNKSSSPNYRRYSPCSNWSRSFKNLDIKFEHFTDTTCYIEQYRRAKQLRIEEKLAKLIQRKEKTINCQKGGSFADKNIQSSVSATEQDSVCARHGQGSLQGVVRQRDGVTVKPSLPQSGYFAGRKWVYPKDFVRMCSKNIGVKCGNLRTQLKRTDKQVHNTSTNMFLQGTGKPLNISCNKNWTVPRHRTACKSAPASRQYQPTHSQSSIWNTKQVKRMKLPAQSNSLTCADLSVLLDKHSITQPTSSLQSTTACHAYEHHDQNKSVDSKNVEDRLEYEKIFRSVFDFYEQNSDVRSHVYINT